MTQGEIVTQEDLNALLCSICPDAQVDDEYAHFLQPNRGAITYLAAKYWDPLVFDYGSIKPDWPLCYDFAECCAARLREAAYRENWPYRPAIFVLRYTMNAPDKRHAIIGVMLDDCHVLYFEPQTGEWLEQPKDFKSAENLYI